MRLSTLAISLAAGAAVAGGVGIPVAQGHAHGHPPTTRAVKRVFDKDQAAPPAGRVLFTNGPVSCFTMPPRGAMGLHYVDPALVADGRIAAFKPEALIYEPQVDGAEQLVGLEYLVLKESWDKTHKNPPVLFGRTFDRVKAPNMFGLPDNYSLHVWLWQANPHGLFTPWNPFVHCPTPAPGKDLPMPGGSRPRPDEHHAEHVDTRDLA